MLCKQNENLVKKDAVTHNITKINQHVIQIDNNPFIQQIKENLIHYTLECSRGSHETKRHYCELISAILAGEGCLLLVRLSHRYLMVPIM